MTDTTKYRRYRRAPLSILAVLFTFTAVVTYAARGYASKADLVTIADLKQQQDPTLVITRGMADIVDLDGDVSDIMVADPSIVDVSALQAHRLYVVGSQLGSTNIIALDEHGNVIKRLNVRVKFDDQAVQGMVDKLFPDEGVKIHTIGDQVVLTGHVSTPAVAAQISDVVSRYVSDEQGGAAGSETVSNMLTVAGEQQVMLKVKVVEASRSVLKELGVETSSYSGNNDGSLTRQSLVAAAASGLTSTPLAIGSLIYNQSRDGTGGVNLIMRALEQNGLLNTLAQPNLTAISGEQAGFLAGGEIPVPTSRDQNGNVIVTYRPFGVSLNFVPTVMSGDLISLQLTTEVSAISSQDSYSLNQITIPAFSVRRAQTTVEIASGGSLMIAGLLKSDSTKNLNKLPGIGNIPVIGDLISSDSFKRDESELLVIVTPYLVKPYADKKQATLVPKDEQKDDSQGKDSPLASVFVDNLRRLYGDKKLPQDILAEGGRFGYLID